MIEPVRLQTKVSHGLWRGFHKTRGIREVIRHKEFKIWNVATGKLLYGFPASDNLVPSAQPIASSPDGKTLAEALTGHAAPPQKTVNVSLDPDKKHSMQMGIPTTVRASAVPEIQLRDARSGKVVGLVTEATQEGQHGSGSDAGWRLITFSPDGSLIAPIGGARMDSYGDGHEGVIYLWDVRSGKLLWKNSRPGSSPKSLEFSPDRTSIACGCESRGRVDQYPFARGEVTLWDVRTGALARVIQRGTLSESLIGNLQHAAQEIRNLFPGAKQHGRAPSDKAFPITAISFSPSGRLLTIGDESGVVKVWKVK